MAQLVPGVLSSDAESHHATAQMLLRIIQNLASRPDRVAAEDQFEGNSRLIVVTVASQDLPAVLGTNGRTARSLRAIVDAIASQTGQRAELEIHAEDQAVS